MTKSESTEIYYFIVSLVILLVFSFFYGFVYSLQELSLKLTYTKMSYWQSFLYFWLVFMYLITLSRQIKLKFNSYYPNLILIVLGLILIFFFYFFSTNTRSFELTVNQNVTTYKTEKFTIGYFVFRILQVIILVILVISGFNIYRKNKIEST